MPGPIPLPNPRRARERLASINSTNSLRQITAPPNTPPTSGLPPKPRPPARKCCDAPNISTDEGSQICYNCGQVLEDSDIVAEVTFAENAAGAAIVQGGFVGENQRHANTMGGTMRGLGGIESRQQTERNGTEEIARLCSALNLGDRIRGQAESWYRLALNHNFVQGRRIRNVAAVAIYLAARKQRENTLMLMDLAEKLHVNVWTLGDTYKKFCDTIMEVDPAQLAGSTTLQEIEPLMLKYCRKLEFAEDSHRVANDACRLLKRMKRDWMVQGRNPAGLCGACIILAARMNNFRRTVREVVYVVKVADTTINQRLYEYKRTPSSALTINQFREFGHRLKVKTQPPAIWRRAEREKRTEERRRKAREALGAETGDQDDDVEVPSQAGPSNAREQPSRASKRQRTNNGAADRNLPTEDSGEGNEPSVPDVDALEGGDSEAGLDALAQANDAGGADVDEEEIIIPKKRGRPPKKREPIVISPEDLEIERGIEQEITDTIQDWESTFRQFEHNENHEVLVKAGDRARLLAQQHRSDGNVSSDPDIGEDEFEDDPDVANVILAPHEVLMKERIWTTVNEDWLREQQAKMLAKALEEAQGKPKKPKQKRKHHQMGDGSVLEGRPAASAAEAAHKMMNKRAKHFSSHINYDRLKELFPGSNSPITEGSTPEGSALGASPAASTSEQRPPQQTPQTANAEDGDAEGDEGAEEDYEEDYAAEEPEDYDDEHQYLSDEDLGFNENENYDY